MIMQFIPCTDNCRYQLDGMCTLDHCSAPGFPNQRHPCVHYLPTGTVPTAATLGRYSPPEAAPNEANG